MGRAIIVCNQPLSQLSLLPSAGWEMSTSQEAAWQCSAAGKVTVGPALHWPHITDCGISTCGLKGLRKADDIPPTLWPKDSTVSLNTYSATQLRAGLCYRLRDGLQHSLSEHANNSEKQDYVRLSTKRIVCLSFLCSKIPVNIHQCVYHLTRPPPPF